MDGGCVDNLLISGGLLSLMGPGGGKKPEPGADDGRLTEFSGGAIGCDVICGRE